MTVTASRVSSTSWTRTICTAWRPTAKHVAARDAGQATFERPVSQQPTDEAFARTPQADGPAQTLEFFQAGQDLQVVLPRLAEADARIQDKPLLRDTVGQDRPQPLLEDTDRCRATTSSYCGLTCMVAGVPCMCIRMTPARASRTTRVQVRIAGQGRDIVDDVGPSRQGTPGPHRPCRYRSKAAPAVRLASASTTGTTRRNSSSPAPARRRAGWIRRRRRGGRRPGRPASTRGPRPLRA